MQVPEQILESIHEPVYHETDWPVFYDFVNRWDLLKNNVIFYYGI